MSAMKNELQINYEETVGELQKEKEEEQQKYNNILQTLTSKEKQLYVVTENHQKQSRAWRYKEEEYKANINDLTKVSKEQEDLNKKEVDKMKGELSKTKK